MKRTSTAAAIDLCAGTYLAAIAIWVIVPRVILDTKSPAASTTSVIAIVAAGLLLAALGLTTGASLGRLFQRRIDGDTWQHAVASHIGWLTLVSTVIAGWVITEISPVDLFSQQGLEGAGRIFKALLSPNFDILGDALLAMVETIYLAFMATAIAVPFSFVLSFFCARNLMAHNGVARSIYVVLRVFTNFSRSIEPLIWAIIFSVWVGIGPFAGMLALVVHTISSLTKQYSEQIEDVDHGPMEAIEATGARRTQVIWFAVVPQCVIPFLSFTIYRWDINVRMATVIGLVGGGGIGNMLIQYQGLARWNEVGAIVIIIAIVVWIFDVVSARVRQALR